MSLSLFVKDAHSKQISTLASNYKYSNSSQSNSYTASLLCSSSRDKQVPLEIKSIIYK